MMDCKVCSVPFYCETICFFFYKRNEIPIVQKGYIIFLYRHFLGKSNYLRSSQPRIKTSILTVWGELNLAKKIVFASVMFCMVFVPMFNTPQAYAGLDITSEYFDEGYDVFIDGISNKKANYIFVLRLNSNTYHI